MVSVEMGNILGENQLGGSSVVCEFCFGDMGRSRMGSHVCHSSKADRFSS